MERKKFLYLSIFALLAIFAWQCEKQPAKPIYDNPLDSENPVTHGDPFALTAEIAGGGIQLSWQAVTTMTSVEGYNLYRKIDDDTFLLLMEITGNTVDSYIDSDISNGHLYSYYIVARSLEGLESTSNTAVVEVNNEPVLSIDDAGGFTPSRTVNLTMLAFGALKMQIGTPDLNSGAWVDYAVTSSIQLSTGAGEKIVQVRFAYANEDTSGVIADTTMPMEMNASFNIENGALYTETRLVDLYSAAAGSNLKAMYSEDSGFSGASWQDYAPTYGFTLSTGAGTKTVYAKFRNDFEVESVVLQDSIETLPINPAFNIAHNAQYTPTRQVWLFPNVSGANIQCKFSENNSFTGVNWQAYADSASFTLSTGAGVKTVYAKFMNDFEVESGVISDNIEPQAMNASFNIEHNAQYTSIRLVTLYSTAIGYNLKAMYSENSSFTGANWLDFAPTSICTLSTGASIKTVYAKFKNDFEIVSTILSDQICATAPENIIFNINHNAIYTISEQVYLYPSFVEIGLLGVFSEDSTFLGSTYQQTQDSIGYLLSSGFGLKTVYGKFVNEFSEGVVANHTIYLALPAPSNLVATLEADSQVNLSWEYYINTIDGFKIERKSGSGDFQEIASVVNSARTFSDCNLNPNYYDYRVRAYYGNENFPYSDTVSIKVTGIVASCGPSNANCIVISGNYAYVSHIDGLGIIDISTLDSPIPIGGGNWWGYETGVAVSGTFAYVISSTGYDISVINVSNPSSPTSCGNTIIADFPRAIAVSGNYACTAAGAHGLSIINIANPVYPAEVGNCNTPGTANDIVVSGNYAYVADFGAGIRIIDISNKLNPSEVGYIETPQNAYCIAISGNYLYVADQSGGLYIYDISNIISPYVISHFDFPIGFHIEGLAIYGNYAYLGGWYPGLLVIDISDRYNPVLVDSLETSNTIDDVAVFGDYVYIVGYDGMQVVLLDLE